MRPARVASIHAERDVWTRRAFDASLAGVQDLVGEMGPIRPNTMISKLGKAEWGWIIGAAISAWVKARAEQAVHEGWDIERTIHTLRSTPEPWDTGAVMGILPMIPKACGDGFDWAKPIGEWPKEAIAQFLLTAFTLIMRANVASAVVEAQGRVNPNVIARETNAAAGNPMMTIAEMRELGDGDSKPPF
jgi:hypothetical protein